MTTFFLIRHAANDLLGTTIAGRRPGLHLNTEGRRQAERLAARLENLGIQAVLSSPLERAVETAEPMAKTLQVQIEISPRLTEIDFGDWTGKTISELKPLELWKQWNLFRSGVRIPHGEHILEVQARMVGELEALIRRFPNAAVAVVSHGDPIRAAVMHFVGLPLDMVHRIEISPASVSILDLGDWGACIRGLNLLENLIGQRQ